MQQGTEDGKENVTVGRALLRAGALARLAELGILGDSVTVVGGCTIESPDHFSYRRDGRTGRQGVLVCTEDPVSTSRMGA